MIVMYRLKSREKCSPSTDGKSRKHNNPRYPEICSTIQNYENHMLESGTILSSRNFCIHHSFIQPVDFRALKALMEYRYVFWFLKQLGDSSLPLAHYSKG
jgi:hypothetical protein